MPIVWVAAILPAGRSRANEPMRVSDCRSCTKRGNVCGIEIVSMRIPGIIVVSAMVAVATTTPRAAAQSPYCLPLQMELADLERAGAGVSGGDDRAIRRQLDRALAEERRAGCRSFFQTRSSRGACRSIRSRISSLQRQLSGSQFGGFFGLGRSPLDRRRDSIREALARNGCSAYGGGGFRTICVRLCDGYYFPLSNTSSRQRFAQDAQKCMGQYGPGEATLFYYPFPYGDASQAVSLDGQRYFDQPNAFMFQNAYVPQCAAQLHAGLAALRERVLAVAPTQLGEQFAAAAEARMGTLSVPTPIGRPDWSSDPETLANRAGNLFIQPQIASPVEIALVGKASRSVGDPYYFAAANPGPPRTVAGYKPPELTDFRMPQRASILPVAR
jgi:hypothetical protein